LVLVPDARERKRKKAGVVETLQALDHAGLLFDGPPGKAGLSFV